MPPTTPPCPWQPPRPQQTVRSEVSDRKSTFPSPGIEVSMSSHGVNLPHSSHISASSHLEQIALGTAVWEGGGVYGLQV